MKRPTVILRACDAYDVERIRTIVREGLDTLELKPFGKTLVKPNLVASGPMFPHAFTRPELTEGVLLALRDRGGEITELGIGERCAITVPTRYAYKNSGYYPMAKRVGGVHMHHFDEVSQVEIPLYHEGRMRDVLYTPRPVAEADFFVNCPKFKAHPWTTVTFSMKNYIGIQDDRHRLIDHDHQLDRKVADLQYITQPQLIVSDAITAGEGRMLTPMPFDMGMVLIGDNQVAFDAVCCHLIGVDPMEVDHIRFAHERGFGPLSIDDIDVVGDFTLEKAQQGAEGFKVGLIRVEDYFEDTNIRAYGGKPPDTIDYCWGGCPGALEEAIEVLRVFDQATDEKLPPIHIVFGHYEGEIAAREGEKIVFIGDCAQYSGRIGEQLVEINSQYVDRSQKNPLDAKYDDIFAKMLRVGGNLFINRKQDVLRLGGCPVSVAEQILTLASLCGLKNPYLDPAISLNFASSYFSWRLRSMIKRLAGNPYNVTGEAHRGAARPAQNQPAA